MSHDPRAIRLVTLIPAYKPNYLGDLLLSLWQQTRQPQRVVISDDSPEGSFLAAMARPDVAHVVTRLNLKVVPGPKRGASANCAFLLTHHLEDATHFHLMLDDDVAYPGFYERHLQLHALGHYPVTVSRRWTANESGMPLRDLPVPAAVALGRDVLLAIDAPTLFATTCVSGTNWLGEVSNAVYRAEHAPAIADPQLAGISYIGLEDIGSFLRCSMQQPIAFINDHLGYFRTHAGQASAQTPWPAAETGTPGLRGAVGDRPSSGPGACGSAAPMRPPRRHGRAAALRRAGRPG